MPTAAGAVAGGAGAVVLGTLLVTAAFVYDMGAIKVSVQEKGPDGKNIRLVVPGAVVPLVLPFVRGEKIQDAAEKGRPWLRAIEVATEELARCPDGPLVQVTSPREKVSIVKRGDCLVIDVDDVQEKVHVSVPLKLVSVVAGQIAKMPPPKGGRLAPPTPSQVSALRGFSGQSLAEPSRG
jgi:hypothetical protein